jgi:thioesterase-3
MVTTEIKVRGYHLDQHGHVNNVRYMEFLEEARYNLLDPHSELLLAWKEKGVLLFIVNININYAQPAFLGDILKIETGISKIGHKSGIIHQEIRKKGSDTPIIDADVTFVAMNTHTGKAMPFEAELHSGIQVIAGDRNTDETTPYKKTISAGSGAEIYE